MLNTGAQKIKKRSFLPRLLSLIYYTVFENRQKTRTRCVYILSGQVLKNAKNAKNGQID